MSRLHLLNYGTGNIGSLSALFDALGYAAVPTARQADILGSPLLVLPGVGSAITAMRRLAVGGLLEPLRERHRQGRPILGICLGAQLLFSHLEESQSDGLGFLTGTVARIPGGAKSHTGWSRLEWPEFRGLGLARALRPADTFFFNHQYALPRTSLARCVTAAGQPNLPALFVQDHLCGIQFHPEKSQSAGRLLVRNLLRFHYGF